jgi:translation initiation factor IF-2
LNAKNLAEKEDIQIKYYTIIYDAIEELQSCDGRFAFSEI